jgi:molybdopterin-binding protein
MKISARNTLKGKVVQVNPRRRSNRIDHHQGIS